MDTSENKRIGKNWTGIYPESFILHSESRWFLRFFVLFQSTLTFILFFVTMINRLMIDHG